MINKPEKVKGGETAPTSPPLHHANAIAA